MMEKIKDKRRIEKMNIDLKILENYKEKHIYITPDYEHMMKFKYGEKNSFYYMDKNNKVWFEKSFLESNKISTEDRFSKYLDIENNEQSLFVRIDCISSIFSEINSESNNVLLSLLTIITVNKRWGTPRKRIIIDKKIYDIHLQEDNLTNAKLAFIDMAGEKENVSIETNN